MWGGRFAEGTAASMEAYTESVSFDWQLYAEDIRGSQAHARVLAKQGFLTEAEARQICDGLDAVRSEIEAGQFSWKTSMEDVHMNIESRLTELIGPVGGKLHTARSRNDQVALDFRLHVAARLASWQEYLASLIEVYVSRARGAPGHAAAGVHPFPARPAREPGPPSAGLLPDVQTRLRARDRLPQAGAGHASGRGPPGRDHPSGEPAGRGDDLGVGTVFSNSMDAVVRPRFRPGGGLCGRPGHDPSLPHVRGDHHLGQPQFRLRQAAGPVRHRLLDHAPEEEPDACELMRGKTGRVSVL